MLAKMTTVSDEKAYEIANALRDPIREDTDAATVFRGTHCELGEVYVVVLPLGNSLLLPIASLDVSS